MKPPLAQFQSDKRKERERKNQLVLHNQWLESYMQSTYTDIDGLIYPSIWNLFEGLKAIFRKPKKQTPIIYGNTVV